MSSLPDTALDTCLTLIRYAAALIVTSLHANIIFVNIIGSNRKELRNVNVAQTRKKKYVYGPLQNV